MMMKSLVYTILIILSIILILVLTKNKTSEGFISYQHSAPKLNQLYINQYAANSYVYKVHDSIYFDSKNGNVIELFGVPFSQSSNDKKSVKKVDTSGTSLTDIILMSRSNTVNSPLNINHFVKSKRNTKLSVDKALIQSNTLTSYEFSVVPNGSNFKLYPSVSFNYQILYIAAGQDTILHVYDCTNTNNVNVGTYSFRKGTAPTFSMYKSNLTSTLGPFKIESHPRNYSFVYEPRYDPTKALNVFQISKTVYLILLIITSYSEIKKLFQFMMELYAAMELHRKLLSKTLLKCIRLEILIGLLNTLLSMFYTSWTKNSIIAFSTFLIPLRTGLSLLLLQWTPRFLV